LGTSVNDSFYFKAQKDETNYNILVRLIR